MRCGRREKCHLPACICKKVQIPIYSMKQKGSCQSGQRGRVAFGTPKADKYDLKDHFQPASKWLLADSCCLFAYLAGWHACPLTQTVPTQSSRLLGVCPPERLEIITGWEVTPSLSAAVRAPNYQPVVSSACSHPGPV